MLYLITCVGLGYGPYMHIARGFSRQHRITNITQHGLRITPHTHKGAAFNMPQCYTLAPQSNKRLGYHSASPHH